MNYTASNETSIDIPYGPSSFHISVQIFLYAIGLFIQIKNIMVCKREKSKSWQIDISHAVVMTIAFTVRIPFMAVSYLSPNIFADIGSWMCYIFAFVFSFGVNSVASHSLIVAILKYVFIVHTMKARSFGEDKMKRLFLFINFLLPLILAINFMIISNVRESGNLKTCFNPSIEEDIPYDAEPYNPYYMFGYAIATFAQEKSLIFYLQLALGIFQTIATLATGTNIVEAVFYFLIFKAMKRYVS